MAQYVYGKNVVSSMLKDNRDILTLFLQEGHKDARIMKMASEQRIRVRFVYKAELDKMVK